MNWATNQDYETEYRQVNGRFNIARMMPSQRTSRKVHLNSIPFQFKQEALSACPPLKLDIGTPGLLDGLRFIEDDTDHELAPDEVEIKTQFSGLNFKDLLAALGRVNLATLGNECAGTITRVGSSVDLTPGDRVCVFHPTAFNTHVRAKATFVAKIPDGVQLAHAASTVLQFSTAHYALHHLSHLKRGETVLIHSGAGGTGQAAIQVAQELGAEIFTTVSSESKKNLLIEEYKIPSSHIFYSRNTSFAQGVLERTSQRGVDVVLNSLSGESLQASRERASQPWRCQSPFQIFPITEVQKGMHMLQKGDTMGKIVFEYKDEMEVPVSLKTRPKFYFDENKTYLIAGGTGGIGRAISLWMAKERGAKNLILLSRSGLKRGDAVALVQELRHLGVTVEAPECNICDKEKLQAVLEEYGKTMPAIGGCIQASMVLKDGIFANMSYQDWRSSLDPKVVGSWNLHALLPSGLDFFIMLSSVAGVLGSSGQANYASGNAYLDALAHYRVSQGERAISLDLGAILEHGVVASDDRLRERLLSGGYLAGVTSAELFSLLEHSLTATQDAASQDDCQVVFGLAPASEIRSKLARTTRSPMSLPFYRHVLASASQEDTIQGTEAEQLTQKHRRDFVSAENTTSAGNVVTIALAERLMPGLPDEDFDEESLRKPIQSYGIDSLMAIELRSWFAVEFSADVPVFHILEGTLASIGALVASKSKLRSTS
ncbi:uncharacterized protein N0V89_009052 [Didymosphaeria variabile]|uniref:Carrier domain-containing protein n=1 Tax=Didymosphaeria variabile TaxID=1932322 RepID=A0A9W8XJC8_9PLEO|nr:uncharacterized protein N0V89_009052 [Didymosphaeria variabile]KAJ4350431.1 hypothetical protein N0V89_009052 [Didymosphaeria variabile]